MVSNIKSSASTFSPYQDEDGYWWYRLGLNIFGPYDSREQALHGYNCEMKAPNPHERGAVWA